MCSVGLRRDLSADCPGAAESALEAIADEEAELEGGGDDGVGDYQLRRRPSTQAEGVMVETSELRKYKFLFFGVASRCFSVSGCKGPKRMEF